MAKWFSLDTPAEAERFANAWGGTDAPADELGNFLLEIAREQVIAYAPVDLTGNDPSASLVYAQLQQAKNLWLASEANSNGDMNPGEYSFTPRPLDKTIRQIIRPKGGVPNVF